MSPESPAFLVANQLLALRRLVAPPHSWRERLLRRAYVPVVKWLQGRQKVEALGEAPPVTVGLWQSPRTRAAALPWPPRILVLKLDHLGDFITALPALAQLRTAFPGSHITFVCGSWNQGWAVQSGLADTVVPFDFFSVVSSNRGVLASRLAAFDALALGPVDLAVDLRHDPDTRPLLALLDAGFRAGFCAPEDMGGDALDIALPNMEHISVAAGTGRPVHAELRLELLVAAVVSTWSQRAHPAANLVVPAASDPTPRPYAVLAPGAGSPIRVWPVDRLAEVGLALIQRHDLDLVLTGGPGERTACAAIAAALPTERVRNLTGVAGLGALPGLISRSSLYVGYDTGATHLAAGLGVPTVAIMGGIPNPDVWHAEGRRTAVVAGQIACSACYLTHADQCAFDVRCISAITVEHVLAACESVLAPEALAAAAAPHA